MSRPALACSPYDAAEASPRPGKWAALVMALALLMTPAYASETARAVIEDLNQRWIEAYQQGNYDIIPEFYTEDALIMPRGRPAIEGREALRNALGGLAAGRSVDIDVEIVELEVFEPHAWLVSRFTVTYTNPADPSDRAAQHGRSLIVYRHDPDGQWRIHRDMDSPAPDPSVFPEARHGD
ncbi:MAG: SgcJ/EcaC family oxidoreductase [Gammaproteobacteria bacterium]